MDKNISNHTLPEINCAKELERYRILNAYCNHDLRTFFAYFQGFLSLVPRKYELNVEFQTEVANFYGLIKGKLQKFDEILSNYSTSIPIVWNLDSNNIIKIEINSYLMIEINSTQDFSEKLTHYRPDYIVISKNNKVDEQILLKSIPHLFAYTTFIFENKGDFPSLEKEIDESYICFYEKQSLSSYILNKIKESES